MYKLSIMAEYLLLAVYHKANHWSQEWQNCARLNHQGTCLTKFAEVLNSDLLMRGHPFYVHHFYFVNRIIQHLQSCLSHKIVDLVISSHYKLFDFNLFIHKPTAVFL